MTSMIFVGGKYTDGLGNRFIFMDIGHKRLEEVSEGFMYCALNHGVYIVVIKLFRFIFVTILVSALISMCATFFFPAQEELHGMSSLLFGLGIWSLAAVIAFLNELHCHTKKHKTTAPVHQLMPTNEKDDVLSKNSGESKE